MLSLLHSASDVQFVGHVAASSARITVTEPPRPLDTVVEACRATLLPETAWMGHLSTKFRG